MKTLLLMRHAKSSWKDDKLEDHERPLKKRGKKNAKRIAKVMQKNNLLPDLILSSSAVRARQTAEIVVETLGDNNPIVFSDDLYMGEPQAFIDVLKTVKNDHKIVMIVGHNPGLEAYLQIIDGEIESMPTAALGYLVLAIDKWEDISLDTMGDLIGFWKPKELEEEK